MTHAEVVRLYQEHVVGSYRKDDAVFVRGKGSWLFDIEGRKYLDFFPGWAVSGLGHCPAPVVKALRAQAGELMHIANNFYQPWQARLAEKLARSSFGGQVFFSNSGAEANEAAIKLCRLYGKEQGRYKIISLENSFHGRSLATVTLTGQPVYSRPFEPLPVGFSYVPLNDIEALRRAVDDATVAVFMEPIQGEGGINVVDRGYLESAVALCRERNLLLAFDEVQTGFGRTGKLFAYQHFGVTPDIMTLAKTMGGGFPIGAMVARRDVAALMVPGTHASTFAGSPLACACGLAVLEMIESQDLCERAVLMGKYLESKLRSLSKKFPCLVRIKGLGLMLGVDLDRPGAELVNICRKNGLLLNCTHQTVLRIMPSLTVKKSEIRQAMDILGTSLTEFLGGS